MQHSEQCRANANLWLEPVPEPEPEPVPEPVPEPEPVSLLQLPPPAPPSCSAADHLRDRCSNTKVAAVVATQQLQACTHKGDGFLDTRLDGSCMSVLLASCLTSVSA
jgi:hypothetical protein